MGARHIKESLDKGLIVKEPIKEIHKKIEESEERVVVLTGNRGSGRSTVLLSKENENLKNNEFSIYHHFDSCGIGVSSDEVGEESIIHCFELKMARVLLHKLKEQGIFTEQDEKIEEDTQKLHKQWIQFINNYGDLGRLKSNMVSKGYYTDVLINEIRSIFRAEKLNLLIDRFDWMFNRNPKAQECVSAYFPLFDKVVLTTDDENYCAAYPTIEVNYGKDKEAVREIINQFIYAETEGKYGIKDICLSEYTLNYIVDKAKGDIESILKVIKEQVYLLKIAEMTHYNTINHLIIRDLEEKVLSRKKLKKYTEEQEQSPKFYI